MTRLADVVELTFGFAFRSDEYSEDPNDIKLLRGDNIAQGRLRWDGVKRFSAAQFDDFDRYQLELGDVVVAMDRPWIAAGLKYSVVREADVPSLLVQRVARLRSKSDRLDQGFLAAVIGSTRFTNYVLGVQTGSAVPHISGRQIGEFEFDLPPLNVQRSISGVLGALDNKIESNRRVVSIAEALGDAMFANIGREQVALVEVADLTMGSSPPGSSYNENGEGLPFYQGIRDFGRRFPGLRVWTTEAIRIAEANDTLFSVRAPVGELNRASQRCCIGRGIASIRSTAPSTIFYALRAAGRLWTPYQQEGTVFGSINRADLSSTRVPWPQQRHLSHLEYELSLIDERIASHVRETSLLSALREALLPQLLAGRIRVSVN